MKKLIFLFLMLSFACSKDEVFNSVDGNWTYETSFSSGQFTIEYDEIIGHYVSGGFFTYNDVDYSINTLPQFGTSSIVCSDIDCTDVNLSVIEMDEQTHTSTSLKAMIVFSNLTLSPDFTKIQSDSATFIDMVGFERYKEAIVFKRK